MKKSQVLAWALLVALMATGRARAVLIDSFDDAQSLQADSGTPSDSGTVGPSGTIVGGDRDSRIDWISGPNTANLDIDAGSSSALNFSLGANTLGDALLQWDGDDNSLILDPTGLGGVDLTELGTLDAICIGILFDDLPVDLRITVHTDGSNASQRTISLGGGIFAPVGQLITFASFSTISGTGADFTNVGAIELEVLGQFPATDLQLDFIKSASSVVPEPSTVLLTGLGMLGLILYRRRRRAA